MIVTEGKIPLPEGLEVKWDRGVDEGYGYTIYGWVKRFRYDGGAVPDAIQDWPDVLTMDFLILTIMKKDQPNGTKKGEIVWWATSSAKWSEKIHDLWFPNMVHVPCGEFDKIMKALNA